MLFYPNKKKISFQFFDSEALKNIHKRVFFASSIFALIFISLFLKLADIMIVSKFKVIENSPIVENDKNSVRGNIYDRNGSILATSVRSQSLSIQPKDIINEKLVINELVRIFNYDKSKIEKIINKKRYTILKFNISPNDYKKLHSLGDPGIVIEKKSKRIYPHDNLTSHVVGFVDTEYNGLSGIEKGLDEDLKKGKDIFLSIDLRFQNIIYEELKKSIEKFSADGGLSIILDINTGEVLASCSLPDFNPNKIDSSNSPNMFNAVTHGVFEMGSTFKPITLAIALNESIIDKNTKFDVKKPIKIGKYSISDYHKIDGPLTSKEVIVNSSNIGAAKMAELIGTKKHKKYLEKFRLLEKPNIEIPEIGNPIIPNPWLPINTMTIGYGYGLSVSPIQLSSTYATLVNGGNLIQPSFLRNNEIKIINKVLKEETSINIRKILRAVILESKWTGPRARVQGYEIGGKTGTAELLIDSKYHKKANMSSFIGVFPISEPKYLVLVMIKNPKGIKETHNLTTGGWVAAPIFSNIVKRLVNIIAMPPITNTEIYKANLYKNKFRTKNSETF